MESLLQMPRKFLVVPVGCKPFLGICIDDPSISMAIRQHVHGTKCEVEAVRGMIDDGDCGRIRSV